MFTTETASVLAVIAAIVLTILIYIMVMPRKKDGTFTKPIWQKLHDFFHFKKLYIEEVLKFIYVLATVSVVCLGIFTMLAYKESYSYYGYGYGGHVTKESMFLPGLLMVVFGPVAIRLAYEGIMMFILLVKNTIEINNKLSAKKEVAGEPAVPAAPVAPAAPAAPAELTCPNCGASANAGDAFCTNCGYRL